MRILVFSLRDLKTIPPTISFINFVQTRDAQVTVFSYYSDQSSFHKNITLINISDTPYPTSFIKRVYSKILFYLLSIRFLIKEAKKTDVVWMGSWDLKGIDYLLKIIGFKGKLVFQFHELEFERLKYCKRADVCVIPEENRLWISYFMGGFSIKPLLLPNIPFISTPPGGDLPVVMTKLRTSGKKILLYQGLVDFKKRCLAEILEALTLTNDTMHIVIMPSPVSKKSELERVKTMAVEYHIQDRVHLIDSLPPPHHLTIVKYADIGIGLYRPISLNQIYAAPNRLYEFSTFGVPLILPHFPSFRSLANKYPFAINVVDPEDMTAIAKLLDTLCDGDNLKTGAENALKFKEENGNYDYWANKVWDSIKKELQS